MLRILLALAVLVLAAVLYVSTRGDGTSAGPPVVPTTPIDGPGPAPAKGEPVSLPVTAIEREPIPVAPNEPSEPTPVLEATTYGPDFDLLAASVDELEAERKRLKEALDGLVSAQTYRDLEDQGRAKILESISMDDLLNSSGKAAPSKVKMGDGVLRVIVLEEAEYPEACATYRDMKVINQRIVDLGGG